MSRRAWGCDAAVFAVKLQKSRGHGECLCEEGEEAPVVPEAICFCVCVWVCDPLCRGSKVGGHDPGDPVGVEIINQLGAGQSSRRTGTHTHTKIL